MNWSEAEDRTTDDYYARRGLGWSKPLNERGFTFLTPVDGGAPLFLHASGVAIQPGRAFNWNQRYENSRRVLENGGIFVFLVVRRERGPEAADVRPVDDGDAPWVASVLAETDEATRARIWQHLPQAVRELLHLTTVPWELPETVRADAVTRQLAAIESANGRSAQVRVWFETAPRGWSMPVAGWASVGPHGSDHPLWSRAPADVLKRWVRERFGTLAAEIERLPVADFHGSKIDAERVRARWSRDLDDRLVSRWAAGRMEGLDASLAEAIRIQMVSARFAEHAVLLSYEARGFHVDDVSITQVTSPEDGPWRQFDLRVTWKPHGAGSVSVSGAPILIDVKNARQSFEHGSPPRVCVKSDKLHQKDVRFVGVVSPYVATKKRESYFQSAGRSPGPCQILGEASPESLEDVQRLAGSWGLRVAWSMMERPRSSLLPTWVFDYGGCGWRLSLLPSSVVSLDVQDMGALDVNPLPWFVAAKRQMPPHWLGAMSGLQRELIKALCAGAGARLDTLYITLLGQLFSCIRSNDIAWASAEVRLLLYDRKEDVCHPLGLHDPTGVVDRLLDALDHLWQHRRAADLASYTNFRVKDGFLVRGDYRGGREKSVMAYCGGKRRDRNNAPCLQWPLLAGVEEHCDVSGNLRCSDRACRYCCEECVPDRVGDRSRPARRSGPVPDLNDMPPGLDDADWDALAAMAEDWGGR